MDNLTEFTINYNDGRGKMTLYLEMFFARRDNKSKAFKHTTKPDIYKVFKLVNEWCDESTICFLLKWLEEHDCKDLVTYFLDRYKWVEYDQQKIG